MSAWFWRTTDLRPGVTAAELARIAGRSVEAARSAARRHGVPLARKPRGWPPGVRARAVRLRAAGESLPRVARAVGVPLRTVQSWMGRA